MAILNFCTDFKLYSAVLILYFAKITGSYALGMSLFSVIMISSAAFEVPTGVFSDRIGRKKTFILGAVSAFLSVVFYATGISYWILLAGAVFEGLSRSFYSGNNDALLYDTLAAEGKTDLYDHYLGKVNAMFQAALVSAVLLGSFIANWSFPLMMWLTVIPQFICVILAFFLTEPERVARQSANVFSHFRISLGTLWQSPKLRLLSLNKILDYGIGESMFEFRSAFVATLWPVWAVGISKMISYTGGGLSFWYSGRLIRKFGGLRIMLFEVIYNRIANIVSLLFPTGASPVIMSTTSFLYGTTSVAANSLMQREFTDTERATLSSIASLGGSLFYGLFAIVLGFIADRTSPVGALLFAEACALPRIFILRKLYPRTASLPVIQPS